MNAMYLIAAETGAAVAITSRRISIVTPFYCVTLQVNGGNRRRVCLPMQNGRSRSIEWRAPPVMNGGLYALYANDWSDNALYNKIRHSNATAISNARIHSL
jgi:hypothetical protein